MTDKKYLIFMSDKSGVLPVLYKYINNGNIKKVYKDNCNFRSYLFNIKWKAKRRG